MNVSTTELYDKLVDSGFARSSVDTLYLSKH